MDRTYYGDMEEQKPNIPLVEYMIDEAFKVKMFSEIHKIHQALEGVAKQITVLNKSCNIKLDKNPFLSKVRYESEV